MDERLTDLMNGELDGTNSAEQSRELRSRLASDPDARRHFEQLESVGRVLAEADEVPPPESLREAIMQVVEERESRRLRAPGLLARAREFFEPRRSLRPAFAFAGGVAVGLCLFVVLSAALPHAVPGDAGRLYGTMGGRCYIDDEVRFEVTGASGTAGIRYCAESVTVGLSLESDSEVLVVLSYDEELDYDGFRAFQPGDHAMRVVGHRAELTHSGTRDYDLYFTDDTESRHPMRLSVFESGRRVFESTVPPGRE